MKLESPKYLRLTLPSQLLLLLGLDLRIDLRSFARLIAMASSLLI